MALPKMTENKRSFQFLSFTTRCRSVRLPQRYGKRDGIKFWLFSTSELALVILERGIGST